MMVIHVDRSICNKTRDLLIEYSTGVLHESDRNSIAIHLSNCKKCCREYKEISEIVELLKFSDYPYQEEMILKTDDIVNAAIDESEHQKNIYIRWPDIGVAVSFLVFLMTFILFKPINPFMNCHIILLHLLISGVCSMIFGSILYATIKVFNKKFVIS